jgi:hypothetical protein
MTRVLALDPGEKVGWASADIAEDGTWTNLEHGILPLRDMAIRLYQQTEYADMRIEPPPEVVVCEKWVLYPHMAQQFAGASFPSVQFIGMVRLCCWVAVGVKLVMQPAGIKTGTNKLMARLNPELYEIVTRHVAHDDGHDQDALTHLYKWTLTYTALLDQGVPA